MQNNTNSDPTQKFINDLFKAKKFPTLESDIEAGIKKDLTEKLDEYLRAHLIKELSDDQVDQLTKLLDENPSVEEMNEFWKENIIDFKTTLTNIYIDFKNLYLQ